MSERERFGTRLAAGPLLLDGAMGTLLFASGVPQRACLDELASTRPELVGAIHRAYVEAGADIVETATFGANRVRLAGYGLAAETHRFNRRAAQVAREARDVAGRETLVAGSIGPLGAPTREVLHLDDAAVRAAFREQIDGLLEGGVDLFVLETFVDLRHLLIAIDEVRAATFELPIIAQLTFGEDIELPDGTTPAAAGRTLAEAPVDAIGVNCGAGPHACLEALEQLGPATIPLSIVPNAGLPQRVEGQFIYAAGPAYLGEMVPRMLAGGATIVGGCCGTTPEHIAAMRAALDQAVAGAAGPVVADAPIAERRRESVRPAILELARQAAESSQLPPTPLLEKLRADRYVISVEIDPPRSIRIDRTIEAARMLREAGVDLVNISDSAMARVRMGAMAVAFGVQHDLDLECLVHFTSRDRSLMALESELLGAHALGVRNILALTGDPPRAADYPTTGVWDVDSIGLVEILARLNRGEDQAGSPIGQPAGFTIACALDPTAAEAATEWDRLERKVAAGAHLIMTQPLYGMEQVEAMFDEAQRRFGAGGFPIPLLLGVLPLQSSRHAEFLHNEVPGITIPDEARAAMRAAGDHGAEVGLEQSAALLAAVGDAVAGTYIMPSFGRYEQCAELVRRVRARLGVEV